MKARSAKRKLDAKLAFATASILLCRPVLATVTFNWVTVGNAGNAADTRSMTKGGAPDGTSGYGSVGYTYQISANHVTNAQYVEFLNKVDPSGTNTLKLYDAKMTTFTLGVAYTGGIDFNSGNASGSKYSVKAGKSNYPATWINYADSVRFVNWLSNGQGSSGTESGVYTAPPLTGSWSPSPVPTRASGATVFLPSEDEYYKAAYYDPTKGGTGGYYEYGSRSDTAPTSQAPAGGTNSANKAITAGSNFWQTGSFNAASDYLTNVGAYTNTKSYYGMNDVEGELYNWTESFRPGFGGNLFPVYRGGSWYYDENSSGASHRNIYSFGNAASYAWFGFRVAGLPTILSGTWNTNSNGTWSTTGNWSGSLPDGSGSTASFGSIITGPKTITLDSNRTVGTLSFDNSNKYTISGSGTLTIDSSSTGSITVTSGSHDITVPVVLNKPTTVTVNGSTNKLKLTNLQNALVSVSKAGTGTLEVNSIKTTGSISVSGGKLEVTANGGSTGVISAGLVTASGSGFVELHDNDLISDYGAGASNYTSIVNQVKSGLSLLGGNGTGIGSSEVDSQTLQGTMLAVVDDGDPTIGGAITSLSGFVIPSPTSSALVKFTWFGDSNLDGAVDGSDYALLDSGFTSGGSLGGWVFGDYDYSGTVDGSDYALIDTGFISQNAVLPEPTTVATLGLGASMLLRRRKYVR